MSLFQIITFSLFHLFTFQLSLPRCFSNSSCSHSLAVLIINRVSGSELFRDSEGIERGDPPSPVSSFRIRSRTYSLTDAYLVFESRRTRSSCISSGIEMVTNFRINPVSDPLFLYHGADNQNVLNLPTFLSLTALMFVPATFRDKNVLQCITRRVIHATG